MAKATILVADDDAAIRMVLNQALIRAGFTVRVTSNSSTLWQWVSQGEGDCVVSDVIMPDGDAFEMVPRLLKIRPSLPIILISAQNTFMTALKSQEVGAYEYLPKPFDLDELVTVVTRAVSEPKNNRPTQSSEEYSADMPLVGRSSAMQEIFRSIARMTTSDMPVMLMGESGTGKRLTARVLHEFSLRKHGPFIAVNLAAMSQEMIETALFGSQDDTRQFHPGAITKADGGTLYLDEISNLPIAAQTRLLRVLIESQVSPVGSISPTNVDIRVITSCSSDMDTLISQGQFREDLYYRMNVVPIQLPSLRDRKSDITDLARHFFKISEMEGSQTRYLDNDAMKCLRDHDWPGNVRELENLIKRICTLYPQETITKTIIATEIRNNSPFRQNSNKLDGNGFTGIRPATEHFVERYFEEFPKSLPPDGVYQRLLEEFEYPVLTTALAATNGNQIKAAKILGLNRNTLRKKIQQHGIRIIKTAR